MDISTVTSEQKIDMLNALAWALHDVDQKNGMEAAQQAYLLAQEYNYRKGLADSLIAQAQFTYSDFSLALTNGLQALAIYEEVNDLIGKSRALFTLCWAHWFADHFDEAVDYGRRAQTFAKQIGDRELEADILNNLGLAYKRSGSYPMAYQVYDEALALYRALGNQFREGKVLTNIALAYASQEDYDQALTYVNACLQLGIESSLINGYTFLALGQVYAGQQLFDEALFQLQQALTLANVNAMAQLSQAALYAMGKIYQKRQQPELAIAHLQIALIQATELGSNLSRFRCHEALSQIYEAQGDLAQALEHFKQFHTIKEATFNDKSITRLQFLQIRHEAEINRREVEIYQLRNVELEKEILERKHLQDELFQQATTDVLTGVTNRRYFMELARAAVQRAHQHDLPMTLALIDLDDFKHVNDTYGHAVGDEVLIALTRVCLSQIREMDIFARLGGDEFVLLLPNTLPGQAQKIVERIRRKLLRREAQKPRLEITISSGIAWRNSTNNTLEAILQMADQALYRAKTAGKNQIFVAAQA